MASNPLPDAADTSAVKVDAPWASPLSPTSPSAFHDAKEVPDSPGVARSLASPRLVDDSAAVRKSPEHEPTVDAHTDAKAADVAGPPGSPTAVDSVGDMNATETSVDATASSPTNPLSGAAASQETTSPAHDEAATLSKRSPVIGTPAPRYHDAGSNPQQTPSVVFESTADDPEKIQSMPADANPPASSAASADDVEKAKGQLPDAEPEADSRPPSLNYTLRTRKLYITVFWSLILIDTIAIPLVLYFCLHYLTDLSPNTVFSVSTACLGGISILEYILRFWRLWRHNSKCRVIGGRRWYLDWFHWNFSAAWIFIMVELIVGTTPDDPPIRLLAMPLSSLCFFFTLSLLVQDILRVLKVPSPVRISSRPAGSLLRPGVYSIIEDICAVDGSGGTDFRRRLDARWNASHDFRQMIHRITLVWAFGMLSIAIATTVLVFTLANPEIAYIVGWTVPFVWAGFLILWTFWYVRRCLTREYANWPLRRGEV